MGKETLLIAFALLIMGGIVIFNALDAPKTNPVTKSVAVSAEAISEAAMSVNINLANEKELAALPGVGEAKAAAIVAYRIENGSFNSVRELLNVDGIGEKLLAGMEKYIVI